MLEPIATADREATYLQGLVRSLAWRSDVGGWPYFDEKTERSGTPARLLGKIASLSVADLEWPQASTDELLASPLALHSSLLGFIHTFRAAQREPAATPADSFWGALETLHAPLDMPLRALVVKHLADLCADLDRWDRSLVGYELVRSLLSGWKACSSWGHYKRTWHGFTVQSIASALNVTKGPRASLEIFTSAMRATNIHVDPLFCANISLDAHVAASHPDVEGLKANDRRVYTTGPLLLHRTHDSSHATRQSLNGKFEDANRSFWANLRRHIALGASTDAEHTKSWYARSLISEANHDLSENKKQTRSFRLGVRLLIEGASIEAATRAEWSDKLVDEFVDPETVQDTIARAAAFDGCRRERELVVIKLFREWIARVSPVQKAPVVGVMWKHLALLARTFPATFAASTDVGRHSLEALKESARKRPECRRDSALEVGAAILHNLKANELWWGKVVALETAMEYADVFTNATLHQLVLATIEVLTTLDPARNVSPLVRPALQFLVNSDVKKYVREQELLGRDILGVILRFGVEQDSEHARLFFYLHDFDERLLRDPELRKKLTGPVDHARQQALETRSSRVTEAIYALLLAPVVSGYDGIRDALEGLRLVLKSVDSERESIGLHGAYDPVLLLVEREAEIRNVLSGREDWFQGKLLEIGELIAHLWEVSVDRPLLFASFSFPPKNKANAVIIHNWAFATMRFAELTSTSRMEAALTLASTNLELLGPINLARAGKSAEKPLPGPWVEAVRSDDREAFYAALGRRLASLSTSQDEAAETEEMWGVLLEGCLRFGPRELDAAVLLGAARHGLGERARASGLRDYARRLAGREQRLALIPLVDLLYGGRAEA
jgi:hypothetical protein